MRRFSLGAYSFQNGGHPSLTQEDVYQSALGATGLRNDYYCSGLNLVGICRGEGRLDPAHLRQLGLIYDPLLALGGDSNAQQRARRTRLS